MRLGGPLVGGMPDGASNNAPVSGALWEKKNPPETGSGNAKGNSSSLAK